MPQSSELHFGTRSGLTDMFRFIKKQVLIRGFKYVNRDLVF